MKKLLIGLLVAGCAVVMLFAQSVAYTSYFHNIHVYTNATVVGSTTLNSLSGTTATFTSLRGQRGVLTHAGTMTLNFATNTINKMVLTGAVEFAFSNLETNRTYDLLLANAQATNCTYVLPAVVYMGYYPTNISAGKYARWWFEVDAQTNSIVYATYVEQQ